MNLEQWPQYDVNEIDAAVRVLRSGNGNYWSGEQGKLFEQEFASYCGVDYGVAVANGSVGLDAVLKVFDIGPGDEVIVPARSFFASAGAVALCGATPIFSDIDHCSQNITAEEISKLVSAKTKAVICVHLNGWPCDMQPILDIADKHHLYVIEDCAQAHGARLDGRSVGSWGDVGVFSFCHDKIMSTGGEGGMIVTNNREIWGKSWSFKDHGKSHERAHANDHAAGFRWLHESFGTNYRLTEFQSAIGRQQLRKLDDWVNRRRQNAELLDQSFRQFGCLRIEVPATNIFHSYYKYYVFVRPEKLANGWDRDRILREFVERGIPALSGSCPEIYLEKSFDEAGFRPPDRLPIAQELGETSIQFLVHPTLTDKQIQQVAAIACDVFSDAGK